MAMKNKPMEVPKITMSMVTTYDPIKYLGLRNAILYASTEKSLGSKPIPDCIRVVSVLKEAETIIINGIRHKIAKTETKI
jgi:hypothetical protein